MDWEKEEHNLDNFLKENGFEEETIKKLKDDVRIDMKINNIEVQRLINEIEAKFFSVNDKTENILFDIVSEFKSQISKNTKKNRNNNNNFINNHSSNLGGNKQSIKKHEKLEFSFNKSTVFNPNNYPDQRYPQFNNQPIKYCVTKDLEIDQYTIIPKDEDTYLDQYKLYFKTIRSHFLEYLKIDEDDPTLDNEKFILMVCFDSSEGKPLLNELVLLDPIKDYTRYTIKFDFDFKEILFNGQVIFVTGILKNSEILCNNIYVGIPESILSMNEKSAIEAYEKNKDPYNIKVCAGPYFSKSNTNLDVFEKILKNMADENPNVLILLGPFLPEDNIVIESGILPDNLSYDEFFMRLLSFVNNYFKDKETTIIIGPSLYDVNNMYPLPQPSFKTLDLKNKNIKWIGNPQTAFINNIIFGISNFDFIKEMIGNSLKGNKPPIDSVIESIILQRSYFPLLPSVVNQEDLETNEKAIIVDYRKCNYLSFLNFIPDIIISPSALNPFAKQSKNTLFVNPGFIFKGDGLGSYANISINCPQNSKDLEILKRIKVEITKLNKIEKMVEDS